jgi:hypothetical protein
MLSSPSAAADGINTINGTEDADTAGDTDELDVRYGPLTGCEWIALSKCFDVRDPRDPKPGEPRLRPEFQRLAEHFNVPIARWRDRMMVENAMQPCLPRENDADHAECVE